MFVSKKHHDELKRKAGEVIDSLRDEVKKIEDKARMLDSLSDKLLMVSVESVRKIDALTQENERLKTAIDLMIKAINEEKK